MSAEQRELTPEASEVERTIHLSPAAVRRANPDAMSRSGRIPQSEIVQPSGDTRTPHATKTTYLDNSDPYSIRTTAAARGKRVLIAAEAGVSDLAEDTAISISAANSIEMMLADEMAAAHHAAMRLIAQASRAPNVDAMVRLTNASARMMDAFQQAALTLHRLRTGGKQTLIVQHVQVAGPAVVAGSIDGGGQHGRT